ncbi:hypothetical protein N9A58_09265 [Opitutales bacterium]|jgi:adenosylhomocysteine nucleosidase|nr:hypothetical protein [Opitutales bacterium]
MNLVVALQKEANPIIQAYGLDKEQGCPLPFYFKENRRLIISGIGRARVSAATAYLMGRFPEKNQPWLNLGIAGHGSLNTGQMFVAGRIIETGSSQCFYPPQIITSEVPVSELTTCGKPQKKYQPNMGYDMEAHAFYQTACLVSTRELVQVLKVVSDNPKQPISQFKPEQASKWIEAKLPEIDHWITELTEAALSIKPNPEINKLLSRITQRGGFSTTRSLQLGSLLRQADALGEDLGALEGMLTDVGSPKQMLAEIEQILSNKRTLP